MKLQPLLPGSGCFFFRFRHCDIPYTADVQFCTPRPKGTALIRSLLLACLISLVAPAVVAAQTPVVIEGLEVIAERQYAVETQDTIDTSTGGVFLVSARVYLFDKADNANSTWDTLVANESVEKDLPNDDSVKYEKTEREDVGDRAMVLHIETSEGAGEPGAFRTIIIQRDSMIVTATVIAGSSESAAIADEIGKAMIEREPGENDSIYDGTGKSRGGVWDVFLPADAEPLQGLMAYADKETRPSN